jgi:hypothetical protein
MMTPIDRAPAEVSRPQRAVSSPQRPLAPSRARATRACAALLLSGAVAFAASGCESSDAAQISAPYVVAVGATEAPSYSDAELTLYESQVPVPFPVRAPTSAELSALATNVSPYPHSPYLLSSDETIEVNYTVTNLDNQSHQIWLLVDPWNEFVEYKPGVTVVSDDETEPNLSGIEQAFILGPMERQQGNIQALDMSNLALKLATAMKIMASTFTADSAYGAATLLNHDFNTQNIPGPTDDLLASYTPAVVAGLTGFNLGLQAYEPMNVSIEVTVNVIDNSSSGKILASGTTTGLIGAPPAILTVPGSH